MTPDKIRTDSRWADSRGGSTVTLFVSLLATVAGASIALTICLMARLSLHECVINTIAGGGVFSLLYHRQTQRNHDLEKHSGSSSS